MWGIFGVPNAVELSHFEAKGPAFCTTCKVAIGYGPPLDGGLCTISWVRQLLSAEDSSPEKRVRVSESESLVESGAWACWPGPVV